MKPFVVLLTAAFWAVGGLVLTLPLAAQNPANQALKEFLIQTALLREVGPACSSYLRTRAREEADLAQVIVTLRRQALTKKGKSRHLSPEEIASCSDRWIARARVLLRSGSPVLPAVRHLRRTAKPLDKDILDSLEKAVHVHEVKQFLAPFLGRGTYPGMFEPLKSRGKSAVDALLFVFLDRREEGLMRAFAAEGVAELCAAENRADRRHVVAPVLQDASEGDGIKESAMILLARLGDAGPLRRKVRTGEGTISAELRKPHSRRNYPLLIQSYETNCNLLQRSGALREAAEVNTDYLRLLLSLCRYETQNEAARAGIARQCYDFACILARLGRNSFALYVLEMSFNWGFTGFDWAREDGELRNLRQDARFAAILKEWSEGNRKPGSLAWNDARFLELAGRVKPMTKPASRPTSRETPDTGHQGQHNK